MVWVQLAEDYNCKLTNELQDRFCEILGKTVDISRCCEYVGICPATWRNWVKKAQTNGANNKKYKDFLYKVNQTLIRSEVDLIEKIGESKDWKAQESLLKRLDRIRKGLELSDFNMDLLADRERTIFIYLLAKGRGEQPNEMDYIIDDDSDSDNLLREGASNDE